MSGGAFAFLKTALVGEGASTSGPPAAPDPTTNDGAPATAGAGDTGPPVTAMTGAFAQNSAKYGYYAMDGLARPEVDARIGVNAFAGLAKNMSNVKLTTRDRIVKASVDTNDAQKKLNQNKSLTLLHILFATKKLLENIAGTSVTSAMVLAFNAFMGNILDASKLEKDSPDFDTLLITVDNIKSLENQKATMISALASVLNIYKTNDAIDIQIAASTLAVLTKEDELNKASSALHGDYYIAADADKYKPHELFAVAVSIASARNSINSEESNIMNDVLKKIIKYDIGTLNQLKALDDEKDALEKLPEFKLAPVQLKENMKNLSNKEDKSAFKKLVARLEKNAKMKEKVAKAKEELIIGLNSIEIKTKKTNPLGWQKMADTTPGALANTINLYGDLKAGNAITNVFR